MSNGVRVVSVQRGYDPRDFVLVAFGGNGAIHAGVQARELRIRRVIVPRTATAFSARGLLNSDIVVTKTRTYIARSDGYDLDAINTLFASMRDEAARDLPPLEGDVFTGKVLHSHWMDMHYKGETHEITVSLGSAGGVVRDEDIPEAVRAFHAAHESLHTFCNPDQPAYLMNLRLEAVVATRKPPLQKLTHIDADPSAALRTRRPVYFEEMGGFTETPIYNGTLVRCGNTLPGPCVIEEPATTIVVYPGQTARLTDLDNYEIVLE
jgi:N-methylhydantoinase A